MKKKSPLSERTIAIPVALERSKIKLSIVCQINVSAELSRQICSVPSSFSAIRRLVVLHSVCGTEIQRTECLHVACHVSSKKQTHSIRMRATRTTIALCTRHMFVFRSCRGIHLLLRVVSVLSERFRCARQDNRAFWEFPRDEDGQCAHTHKPTGTRQKARRKKRDMKAQVNVQAFAHGYAHVPRVFHPLAVCVTHTKIHTHRKR